MKNLGEVQILNLFPTPVYSTVRASGMNSSEIEGVKSIISAGTSNYDVSQNATSNESYVLNTGKFEKIKEFCQHHIQRYVDEIICPAHEIEYYISQSWLNVHENPNQYHRQHSHPNSFMSGVYYIKTIENDKIAFHDSNSPVKKVMKPSFNPKDANEWNSDVWHVPVFDDVLIIFPAWFEHSVPPNDKNTSERISLAFNVFAKGTIGEEFDLTRSII
jgi:uncharacterized protein (TIGR02466 family)